MDQHHIRVIRRYLRLNGIKYEDVQHELIDHFAISVDKILKENLEMPFKHALLQALRAFGGRVELWKYRASAEERVKKKINSMFASLMLELFHWPYILLSACIFIVWYFVFHLFTPDPFWTWMILIWAGIPLVLLINYQQLKRVPLFAPRQVNKSMTGLYLLMYFPGTFIIDNMEHPEGWLLAAYFSFICFTLISFARIPRLAIKETLKNYPQIA